MSARRSFLAAAAALPLAPALAHARQPNAAAAGDARVPARLKLSCNLYSFNEPLRSGAMSLEQAIDFCAELGFDAVDPTGYYFPGYPAPPSDAYVNAVKRRAFRCGLGVSGTGVRNDFTQPDAAKRAGRRRARRGAGSTVASRLGAPVPARVRRARGRRGPDARADDRLGGRGASARAPRTASATACHRSSTRTTTSC